ncbi:MAG: hypothetical protein DWQ47_05795 [Acidobacteria bacterium]|nr:MAG: hypothetical protein DWQ32_09345 [Acidobacteriota bacterium]REK01892.1 MAG: hypothetical protein DWQ38_05780 [Acidobacteriota bacterium]REK14848.1 MAG: hypothetical protein DWQ43_15035 [Acidobacteriota bacterium]REK45563.1 MAG: hypothetical protein DWQ47_05795 [Acidobacteriota bacterium]
MIGQNAQSLSICHFADALSRAVIACTFLLLLSAVVLSQTQVSEPDQDTLIVENAPEMEVFAFGKTVIVKGEAKGVLSFGGDVVIEGKVKGEVATIGGNVLQRKDAYIGGDVIIFGGSYQPEVEEPLRSAGSETVVYAGYEEELRNLSREPSRIFAPDLSIGFLVQRLLSLLFWFGLSVLISFLTPGAVGRAAARIQLSPLKVFGIGGLSFIVITLGVMLSLGLLPGFVSGVIGVLAFVVIMLAYVFGRVVLQSGTGKFILRRFTSKKPSETLALLIGAFTWTVLLSIPYLWTAALFVLFTASLGLVFTSRSKQPAWQES